MAKFEIGDVVRVVRHYSGDKGIVTSIKYFSDHGDGYIIDVLFAGAGRYGFYPHELELIDFQIPGR